MVTGLPDCQPCTRVRTTRVLSAWPWGAAGTHTARAPKRCPARPGCPHPGSFGPDPWPWCQAPHLILGAAVQPAPSPRVEGSGLGPAVPPAAVRAEGTRAVRDCRLSSPSCSQLHGQPAPAEPLVLRQEPRAALVQSAELSPTSVAVFVELLAGPRLSDGAHSAGWGPWAGPGELPCSGVLLGSMGTQPCSRQPRCTLLPSVFLGGAALSNNIVRRAASPRATAGRACPPQGSDTPGHCRGSVFLGFQ